jgi:hypothetical protein
MRTTDATRCCHRSRPHYWVSGVPAIRDGRLQAVLPHRPVHEFAEQDYCYGVGSLMIKVDRIVWDRPVPFEGDTWLEVEGTVIDGAGREGPRRQVLVRAGRLPLRPPRKRPRRRP